MIRRILLGVLMVALLIACQPGGFVPAGQPGKAEPTISATATAARESVTTKAVMIEPQGFIQRIPSIHCIPGDTTMSSPRQPQFIHRLQR